MSEALLSVIPDEPIYGIDPSGFYQTPNSMTIKAINSNLTGADWKLWEYLKASEPFGDRMEKLDVAKIAKAIKISIRQFKRSLKKLEELGLYYSEPVILQGQNLAGKLAREISEQKKQSKSSGKNKMTDLASTRQSRLVNDEPVQPMTDLSSNRQDCPIQPPQPASSKDSATPQTIQTYSDFIETLSEGEREKFLDWSKNKVAGYKKKVVNLDDYLASQDSAGQNRWEIFHKEFKQEATENQLETSQDEQNKILRRRAEAQEFLSRRQEDLDLDQNSAPPREKSAAPPPDFAEIDKLLNEPEERSEGAKRGANSTGVDRNLVNKLKKQKQQRGFGFRDKKP